MTEKQLLPDKGPSRIFVGGLQSGIRGGLHEVIFRSGEDHFAFALPLNLSKSLARALAKQIKEVEKKIGKEIPDVRLSDEPMLSPMSSELKKDK